MIFVVVFVATIAALEVLRHRAGRLGLMSYPGAHRLHSSPTPLVGGLGVFAGLAIGVWLLPMDPSIRQAALLSGGLLVAVGAWDDIFEASFRVRFLAQALAVSMLAFTADVSLRELGYIFDTAHPMALGRWGMALTIFAAVGLINAVNMSDGLDGLAGGLSLVSCTALLAASWLSGQHAYTPLLGVVTAALAGFLLYNARLPGLGAARLYLGDAGSLLIGFILAWFLIAMTQGEGRALAPVTALWILALPLFDTVAALLRRPLQGRSPFHADRTHYHHYLRELGLSVNQILLLSLAVAAGLAALGLYFEARQAPEHLRFYAFLALFGAYFALMLFLDRNIARLREGRRSERILADDPEAARSAH
ncbi:MAG TPA: MraY family glycosyltransferase [Arenicellales bacterium]|nr:MraY family glycosyltransferase [Arenicellales bacterium]